MLELHLHSPVRLHGVVPNQLSTGTVLPSPFDNTNKPFTAFLELNINLP
jgi:hypothetical protein